jgi:hypothetical protein
MDSSSHRTKFIIERAKSHQPAPGALPAYRRGGSVVVRRAGDRGESWFGLLLTDDPGGCGYSARIQTLYGLENSGFQKIFKVLLFDSFIPGG